MSLDTLHREMRACRQCLDAGFHIVPGAVFSGPQSGRIMVVGQAPGIRETEIARPFSGPSGKRLFDWFSQAGWEEQNFRRNQYITAITKCFPGKGAGGRGDRVPTRGERELCRPFLERELALVAPDVIVPVGGVAIETFLGRGPLTARVGRCFEKDGRLVIPLPHPSGASLWLNRPENRLLVGDAIQQLRDLPT